MGRSKTIFGGEKGWIAKDWTSSDDRVRGGKSQSYLDIKGSTACFHGNLDIKTLGGAGFASQRTTGDDRTWDLSAFDGIHLDVGKDDGKRYTFVLKDKILPPMADGREQSTISYEYDFSAAGNYSIFVPWSELKPTYRGKAKSDAPPLNTKSVKRWSFMMRSFFGDQEGDFAVEIKSVKAVLRPEDFEAGLGEKKEPWSWKNSRVVGLALIFSTTWAICTGICWYKGLDISMMTPRNWWRMARLSGIGNSAVPHPGSTKRGAAPESPNTRHLERLGSTSPPTSVAERLALRRARALMSVTGHNEVEFWRTRRLSTTLSPAAFCTGFAVGLWQSINMAPDSGTRGFSTFSLNSNTGQTQASARRDNKGRKFFQQMQPTFSIDVPTTTFTKLEFLDNFDPAKDTVVRKKAREWVNKNREISNISGQATSKSRSKNAASRAEEEYQKKQVARLKSTTPIVIPCPKPVAAGSVDPFGLLPNIGRNFDHIIKYFLSANCPEEIPCSDDKYADKSKHALVSFQHDNTVLGSMAKSELTFVLWLYATVIIRDGMLGTFNTEEVHWFYNKSLKMMQDALQKETAAGQYSDYLINAVSCITAAAVFSGMFNTAVLHRDALVRLLTCRGDGDLLKGWQSTGYFTRKASQWCEIMVAAQLAEIPKLPRQPQGSTPLPEQVIADTDALTATTLRNLPQLSYAFVPIIRCLHQVAVSYASPPSDVKIDDYIIQPMHDVQHAILGVLAAQKEPGAVFTDTEVVLAESFQLYFWTGTRGLPPQTRLCELLISRVMKALLPLLLEASTESSFETGPRMAAAVEAANATSWADDHMYRFLRHTRQINNAITWALALGTLVTAPLLAPEHSWFKDHFRLQLTAMGLDKHLSDWLEFLRLFPTTDGYPNPWIDLKNVWRVHGV
ncbi:hypothetical protein OPT61_g4187 [Boeremia exigua]|uniref:Uncharacterized protein n=1 Tax=Boeremia exigua TaxID=749465 RepID=A0ACC2IF32_9PLEO|nr:hypothetical protein OPT61_g4187 [Boeremia exigua]